MGIHPGCLDCSEVPFVFMPAGAKPAGRHRGCPLRHSRAHPPSSFPRKRESRDLHENPVFPSLRANLTAPCMPVSRRIPFRGSRKMDSRFRGNDESEAFAGMTEVGVCEACCWLERVLRLRFATLRMNGGLRYATLRTNGNRGVRVRESGIHPGMSRLFRGSETLNNPDNYPRSARGNPNSHPPSS